MSDMGTFRVEIEIENLLNPGRRERLTNVLVDTGAELTCIPAHVLESLGIERRARVRLRQADGTVIERWTGFALVYAGGTSSVDNVIFGEPGDIRLLGAHSLEGLNLRVDPVSKQLVDGGPMPWAAVA